MYKRRIRRKRGVKHRRGRDTLKERIKKKLTAKVKLYKSKEKKEPEGHKRWGKQV